MGCERYEPHLTAYLDNELSDEGRSMVERHLRVCVSCRQIVAELRATQAVMKQWKDAEVGDDFMERMRERIRLEKRRERRTGIETQQELREPRHSRTMVVVREPERVRKLRVLVKVGMAASVLIVAGQGLLMLRGGQDGRVDSEGMTVAGTQELMATVQTAKDLREVALATEPLVRRVIRQERPKVDAVIGAETVQLLLETARETSQQRYLEVLLGYGGEDILALGRPGMMEMLGDELAGWMDADLMGRAYGQDVPAAGAEMTPRTEATLTEGLRLERTGRYSEAIEAYEKVEGSGHERAVAQVRKAGLLIRLGRVKEAQEALTSAERSTSPYELMKRITDRLRRRVDLANETREQVEGLKRSLAAAPEDVKGWRELADLELACGNYAGASEALAGLAGQVTGDEEDMVRFRAAWCEKNRGEYEKALAEMERLRGKETAAKDVRTIATFESADILYRCGRYAQSIDAHKVLIGYPGEMDDASRGLLILRVGYIQYYDLADEGAARGTLKQLVEPRYRTTPAGQVGEMMLREM